MPEEFEKNIKRKMQGFNLEPSPQVWNEIDAALGEKKRRRFVIWWLVPVMLVAGGVWYFGSQKSAISSQQSEEKKQSAISNQQSEDRSKKLEGKEQLAISNQQSEEIKKIAEVNNKENKQEEKHSITVNKKTKAALQERNLKADNNIIKSKKEERSAFISKGKNYDAELQVKEKQEALIEKKSSSSKAKKDVNKTEKPGESKTEIAAENIITENASAKATDPSASAIKEKGDAVNNFGTENKTTETGIIKKDSAIQQQIVINDLSIAAVEKTKQKKQRVTKGNWRITVGTGLTGNKETSSKKLLSYAPVSDYLSGVNTPGNSNGNGNNNSQSADSTAKIFKPGEGYHFFAGISYDYTLSKRWKISTGLQYRFLSNTQKAGKSINSTLYLGQYSGSFAFSSVPSYYNAGYASTITNKTNWLEVPVNIEYTVNPSGKTKIFLGAGTSYAWMFSSKWIIPDSRSNRLYYHEDFLNNHIFNWQAGAGFTIRSGFKFGLQYQQSTTFVAKFIEPHLRWQNISIYTGIPLFKNKRTNK